jgi:ATP-dependent Clp protease adaptor protein ClpS
MAQKTQDNPLIRNSPSTGSSKMFYLVLYNDDINSFDFVIKSLMEICDHTAEQAEQCAIIAHFKGKCDVKKGVKADLQPMQFALISRTLKALIE